MPHANYDDRTMASWLHDSCKRYANGGQRRRMVLKYEHRIGCRIEHLVARLKFRPDETRHIDHIIPLAAGGSWHFTNLRMLAPVHNHARPRYTATPEDIAAVALLELHYKLNKV